MTIFQKSVIKRHLDNLDKEQVEKSYQKFRKNYNPAKIEEIKKLKEEEYQDGFLRDIFVNVFGYILKPDSNYNLAREFKNQGDGKKADGAILKNEKAVAVIELKSTKTKDLKSITDQAFNYKNNQPECKYVITSNFQKLRFYIDYAHDYEEFDLFNLQKEDFELLYLLLSANSIFSDLPLKLKEETKFHEQQVTDKLYKDYSVFKNKLFENLIKNNPDNDKLILFNKSQKLLDRFLFILFAEDSGLLPPNSISRIIDTFRKLTELDAYKPIYDIYKQYFGYMNIGRKGKTNADDIPAYNGGLFYTDELLDNLKIDDSILIDDLLKLSEYDFNTEVDVNILGHIFEHSLSEIEEITAGISASRGHVPLALSKRKKDGVFYTPKYITQYIVENTIGTLCNKKRKELEIEEIEFDGSYRAKDGKLLTKGKKLYKQLNDYKDWLLSLKIVDPACGSGAFLNQALNFLIAEHKNIDDIIAELTNTVLRLFDTDKAILENNLYGVDINEESVEIAKLSLWLRTAQKGRKLSNLNDNIKCGNSLIDDPEVAGEKAFDWNVEFPQIFKKKEKIAWHITTATHNSRYSQRMFDNHVTLGEAIWIDEKDEIIVTETIAQIVKEDNLNVIEYNICGDHIHILLVCDKEEVPKIMGKIKGVSGRRYNIENGITVIATNGTATRGHVPLSGSDTATDADTGGEEPDSPEKKKYNSLWTQKFGDRKIKGEKDLQNVINYIRTNRQKHELPKNIKLEKIIGEMCCTIEYAFRTEYKGGFDVVIGNPPYVNIENLERATKKAIFENYVTAKGRTDLYIAFVELSFKLIKDKGLTGLIIPFAFTNQNYGELIRRKIIETYGLIQIVDTSAYLVFADAMVKTVIVVLSKEQNDKPTKIFRSFEPYLLSENLHEINQKEFLKLSKAVFETKPILSLLKIKQRLEKVSIPLENICLVAYGVRVNSKTDKTKPKSFYISDIRIDNYKQFVEGKDISRYWHSKTGWLNYQPMEHYNSMFPELFENEKLMFINIVSNRVRFSYDNQNLYNSHTVINCVRIDKLIGAEHISAKKILKNNDVEFVKIYRTKFLLTLVNSNLLNWYFFNFQSEGLHFYPDDAKQFPIIKITKSYNQQPFIEKADKMLALNQELQTKSTRFTKRVTDNFEIDKITKKLEVFYNYDFKTFVTELKKQKIKLSLVQQDEWEEYFNANKTEINQLQTEISTTDKEIDQMVYELYGLTEEEIGIVEGDVL